MTQEAATEEQAETTETEATSETGGEGSGESDGKLWAKKYKTPEAMEVAMEHSQEHIAKLETEAKEREERFLNLEQRVEDETQARRTEATSTSQEQKTPRQIADDEFKRTGNWMDSMEAFTKATLEQSQKSSVDRATDLEQRYEQDQASQAIRELRTDAKAYPQFKELEKDIAVILNDRQKRNPDYRKAFGSTREMLADAYTIAAHNKPELFKPDASLAAAATGGVGSSPRNQAGQPEVQKSGPSDVEKRARIKKANKIGIDVSVWQDRKSDADLAIEQQARDAEALQKALRDGE